MPSRYLDFLIEQLSPLGEITTKAMFGGHCIYCDGLVFGLIANEALYLKADAENRPDFEARRLEPFRPFDDQAVTMSYYPAPPEIFEDAAARDRWVGGAIEASRRARAGKKPRAKSGRRRA